MMMQVSSPSPKYQQIRTGLLGGVEAGTARKPLTKLVMDGVISNNRTVQFTGGGGTMIALHFRATKAP